MYRNSILFIMEWIWRLVYLNVIWILFSLPIITIIPSTFAMFSVANKWFVKDEDIAIFHTFKKDFKFYFFASYRYSLPLILFGLFLYFDLKAVLSLDLPFFIFVRYVIITTIILYAVILIFSIPIYLNYQYSILKTYLFSLMLGLRQPIVTLIVFIFLLLIIGLFIFLTGFGVLFIGSLSALMISKATHNLIKKLTIA